MRARIIIASLAIVSTAFAGDTRDYRADSPAWNGLSRFVEQAASQGCAVTVADSLDWKRLSARDVLFFVYPQSPVDAEALGEFLTNGGRALIADDFGAAAPAFEALQLHRITPRLEGVLREPGHPELPVARVKLLTTLGHSTPRIVTNHPAAFETALPATYELSPAQALVVEGHVGKGRFVALADPSVLINNMQELEGNGAFARAVIAELCAAGNEGDRVHLYSGAFRTSALQHAAAPSQGMLGRLNDLLGSINRSIEELLRGLMGLPIAILVCAAVLALAWSALLRARAAAHADGHFVRVGPEAPHSQAALVDMMPRGESRADHALALMLLRHEVLRRVADVIGPLPSDADLGEVFRRVERARGAALRDELACFFAEGPRSTTTAWRRVPRRTFLRALSAARPILHRLNPDAPQGA